MVGVAGEPEPVAALRSPGRRSPALLKPDRRSENATSSATVGITIWLSGSVNTNPTRRRTSRALRGGVQAVDRDRARGRA